MQERVHSELERESLEEEKNSDLYVFTPYLFPSLPQVFVKDQYRGHSCGSNFSFCDFKEHGDYERRKI